ncbi:hypothetical protein [Capnocytophaga felis]|uniref:Uncharacterized protein n=1 Tax=Capnocytophaga felis TaxID=2267611 RepID=A0A5M4B8E8_9FLAO|nr:hypothetical protein [Capnocytophaga felis]GET45552.1 hypothetical protein RCZ01_08540 [Capnocytophaga felis]GET47285.1 hypothetical protein RCZ02_01160 [Capnocytophaga felis]
MTQKEYAEYLGRLIGEEIDTDSDMLEDEFYAYFQCFMPYGENIDKVFEPVPNGQALCERLKPIFKATEEEVLQSFDKNVSPGYFVPDKKGEESEIKAIGKQFLKELTDFASFLEDETLQQYLADIKEIEISKETEQNFDDDKYSYLCELFSDWMIDNTDYDSLISILREAYYSISCDYFLSAYLQYPSFTDKPSSDFLKPYFNLWQKGYNFVINDNRMILFTSSDM